MSQSPPGFLYGTRSLAFTNFDVGENPMWQTHLREVRLGRTTPLLCVHSFSFSCVLYKEADQQPPC